MLEKRGGRRSVVWVEEYALEPFFTFRKCRAQVGGGYLEPFPTPYSAYSGVASVTSRHTHR